MFYISNRIQSYHSTNGMAKEATTGLYKYMVLNNLLNITSQFENFIKKYNILKYTLTNIDITSIYTSVKYSDIKCYLENYLNAMQKKKKFIINEDSNYNISYAEAFATETPNLYAAKSFNCSDFKGLNYTELSILSKYTYIDYYKFSRRSIGAYESLIKAFDNKTLIFGIGDITKVDDIEYFYHAFQKNILKMKMTKKDLNLLKVNEHINFQNSLKINRDKDNYTIYILSKNKSKFLKNYEKNINTLTENEYENFKNLIKCKLVNGDTIILGNKNEIFNNSRMFSEIILL